MSVSAISHSAAAGYCNLERLKKLSIDLDNQQMSDESIDTIQFWDMSPDILIIIDNDGNVVRVNGAISDILGWGTEEIINYYDIVKDSDIHNTKTALHTSNRFHNMCKKSNGDYIPLEWTTSGVLGKIYLIGRQVPSSCLNCPQTPRFSRNGQNDQHF